MGPIVYLVDDDPDVLKALSRAVRATGYDVVACQSANDFLITYRPDSSGCVVLDLFMPVTSGEDLHLELLRRGACPPLIYISGRGDVPSAARAMKNGALDFLTKPIDLDLLIHAISDALATQRAVENGAKVTSNQRLYSLSCRELEVFAHLIRGWGDRDISATLGVSLRTIKAHRAQIRKKLGVRSIAEFTKVAIDADFTTLPVVPAEYCGRGGNRRTPAA